MKNYTKSSVFVYSPDDFTYSIKGILGLIANKTSNKFKIVSLIGTPSEDGKLLEFSGRSVPNYNLHQGIERIKTEHPELGITGGHAQAMGIKFKNEEGNLEKFKQLLESDIETNSGAYDPTTFEYEPEMEKEIFSTMEEVATIWRRIP